MAHRTARPHLLITGGAGFLGTALARAASARYDVTLLDNLTRDSRGFFAAELAGARFLRADVTDPSALGVLGEPDLVVHMAAVAGVRRYYEHPFDVLRVNAGGLLNILTAFDDNPPGRFVFLSTSEVYGRDAADAREESDLSVGHYGEMRWTYAVSKIAGEKAALAWGAERGVDVVAVRPFNVYGPGQTGEGAVRDMILAALRGGPIVVHGDGTASRAWCYVDDFIDGLTACLEKDGVGGEVFNIGHPDATATARDLAERIAAKTDAAIESRPQFGLDIETRLPNIDKARRVLGFAPRVGLDEGLDKTIAWYRDHEQSV